MSLEYVEDSKTGCRADILFGAQTIRITTLFTPEENRQRGGATRVVGRLCGVADCFAMDLIVYPVPDLDSGLTRIQLIVFYENFGFELDDGITTEDMPVMIRRPEPLYDSEGVM